MQHRHHITTHHLTHPRHLPYLTCDVEPRGAWLAAGALLTAGKVSRSPES